MTYQIQLRRDSAANWTAVNPVLAAGEPGLETDTGRLKYGDGVTHWNSLNYPTLYSTPTPASALTGTTLPPNILNSSLTSVGTLTNLTVTNTITGSISGNAATATTALAANSATSATSATSAGTATTLAGGSNLQLVYQTGTGQIAYINSPAASTANQFLSSNGSVFAWSQVPAAAAGTLTGATLASNVLASSLTSVGTLATLTVTATITGSVSGSAGSVSAGNITGNTLASGVTSSSLTTVGTLANLIATNATVNNSLGANAGITTTATTFPLVNTTATTVNFAGAATSLNMGNASGTTTITGKTIISGGSLTFSGNISATAWTTSGIRHVSVPATLTDTTSTGTVANAYTNNFGGNTIAASNVVTYTNYGTVYLNNPTAGTNVTITNPYSLITAGNVLLGGDLAGTATQNVFNTLSTSVNAFGAAATLSIGAATGTASINNATVTLVNATNVNINGSNPTIASTQTTVNLFNTTTTTINFGGGTSTALNIGAANSGTTTIASATVTLSNAPLNINNANPTIATTATTGPAAIFNTNILNVTAFGAATTVSIGAATGTTSINNTTVTLGNATTVNINGASPTLASSSAGTLTLFNTNLLTVNAFGAATTIAIGATTGSTQINNPTLSLPNATSMTMNGTSPSIGTSSTGTVSLFNTNALGANLVNAATTITIGNTATAAQTVSMFTASTGASTYNFATGATASATTKTINLGTGGATSSTTNVLIGSTNGGLITLQSATQASGITITAGTNTVAPLKFTSGTNLTAAAAGAVEYDGSVFYASPAASTRSIIAAEQYTVLTSVSNLTSTTSAQKLFNTSTNGAVTLAVGNYQFECFFSLSAMNAGSGQFGFALGGTATFTQSWYAEAQKSASNNTAATPFVTYNTSANTGLTSANTATLGFAFIRGYINVTVAGTVVPQVSLTVANLAIVGVGSYFKISPLSTTNLVGNWS